MLATSTLAHDGALKALADALRYTNSMWRSHLLLVPNGQTHGVGHAFRQVQHAEVDPSRVDPDDHLVRARSRSLDRCPPTET